MYKGAYVWDDLPAAFADVQAHFAQLQRELTFDPDRVVLAGHSMGGLVAIHMALAGALKVRGFVANGPAVPFLETPEELEALLPAARERRVRGYLIVGAKDEAIFADKIQALAERLQSAGIACQIENVPEATHDYTSAYDSALLRALEFVAGAG
jgi:dienelactone hydrolase